jgi:pyruvate kinase
MTKPSKRDTKIICTLGPASDSIPMMKKMAERGMDVARINFSHASQKHHKGVIDRLREMNSKFGFHVKILQDLTGYRIRVGHMKKKRLLEKNKIFYMSNEEEEGGDHIPFDYPEDIKTIKPGMNIFIDDGYLRKKV